MFCHLDIKVRISGFMVSTVGSKYDTCSWVRIHAPPTEKNLQLKRVANEYSLLIRLFLVQNWF